MTPPPSAPEEAPSKLPDLYAPPLSQDEPLGPPCPKCSQPMRSGVLRSSSRIRWADDGASRLRKALFGGTPIGKIRSGIGCPHRAHHCPACRLFLLLDD